MSDADNAHDRETDEWIVPADLKRPPTALTSGPESDATSVQAPTDPPPRERAPTSPPASTVAAFEAAMRRDGADEP